ncbi:uncharacterized protein BDZ83DRAFT_619760 [Colletotrichum acutatum]|uniref:Secreted protein n=1 Tax=Glomerella acutata TaxID=27357 RepID=A0AAD8UQG7_GLOAC|nr:uncharacterized protein BDZ83DRAFT_619760 [Colletotrichum acutatum]KAK1725501.1 hypothetical protein BDZ83DRAFT_619760 [Colletotrichum acutatum]
MSHFAARRISLLLCSLISLGPCRTCPNEYSEDEGGILLVCHAGAMPGSSPTLRPSHTPKKLSTLVPDTLQ